MKKNFLSTILLILVLSIGEALAQQPLAQTREKIYTITEQMPALPGGEVALENYFKNALAGIKFDYPGWIVFSAVIDKTGQPQELEILRSPAPEQDATILEATRNMPRWHPGKKNGQPVNIRITIPVSIANLLKKDPDQDDTNRTYIVTEEMPKFPGGEKEILKFINKNKKFPTDAWASKEQGLVVVQFVITKTGQVKNPEIIKSFTPGSDAEAIRLINAMPNWTPGKKNGQTVNVYMTLPIRFK